MERVQFQQEQMLAELKDLEQKGLFSHTEIKFIMKKRTAFENALVRRVPKKGDFLRYAAYEMGLEALRRKRVKRLNLPKSTPSISDFALVRRQFHIFERALRKFKADVALWVQYIELAKREGARALVGRISARALQLHPTTPSLYIFAAQHEVDNLSPAAARALLQRGIRLNGESVELWVEYVKFEMGFVEGVRRRWGVLGVRVEAGASAERDEMEDTSEAARTEIMQGAIVTAVISEAAKALPNFALFNALHTLLRSYPALPPLRAALLAHLHALLIKTLPEDPEAVRLYAMRWLNEVDASEDFVDNLRAANEELLERARTQGGAIAGAYAAFVEEWCEKRDLDPNLRLYLVACLQGLAATPGIDARVLAAHVRLLSSDVEQLEKAVQRGRKYTRRAGGDAGVWLARLDAERRAGVGDAEVVRAWGEARRVVKGNEREKERVWMWGLREGEEDGAQTEELCERLLRESMGEGNGDLHVTLLLYYVTRILHRAGGGAAGAKTRAEELRKVVGAWPGATTARFLRTVFVHEARMEEEEVVRVVYEAWRRCGDEEEAGAADMAWAGWLCAHGEGARAAEVMARMRGGAAARMQWSREMDGDVGEARRGVIGGGGAEPRWTPGARAI